LFAHTGILQVKEASEKEWEMFKDERAAGVEEIKGLRQRVAEEQERRKAERESRGEAEPDKEMAPVNDSPTAEKSKDRMDVDDTPAETAAAKDESKDATAEPDAKDEPAAMLADDDDAVEY
jgi:hypothetical protein